MEVRELSRRRSLSSDYEELGHVLVSRRTEKADKCTKIPNASGGRGFLKVLLR